MTRRRRPRIISPGTSVELADGLELDPKTIRKWRNRFTEKRYDGMLNEPRPRRPRWWGDDQIEDADHRHARG
jgi:transposase